MTISGSLLLSAFDDDAGQLSAAGLAGLTYDGLGRRQQRVSGGTTDYGYDTIGRLTLLQESFTGGGGAINGFSYNPASQIVGRTRDNDAYAFSGYVSVNRAYAVNGLNQYASAGPASFSYDANGNLTGDGARSYVYDAENRLVSASNGLAMAYDPLGRLFQTSGAVGITQFLYDGDALVAEYAGSSGPVLRRYVHGAGVDEPLIWYEGPAATPGSARHLKANHQGSIVALTDANGQSLAINSYDEYGIPSARNMGRFQYTGQAWIPELGMYHYKARIYSPTLGRFLQTDPIGYEDQVNLYAYVGDDPVNSLDGTGSQTVRCSGNCAVALQAMRDFGAGALSLPRDAGAGARHLTALSGALGAENAARAMLVGDLIDRGWAAVRSNPQEAGRQLQGLIANNKSFLAGRGSASAMTTLGTGGLFGAGYSGSAFAGGITRAFSQAAGALEKGGIDTSSLSNSTLSSITAAGIVGANIKFDAKSGDLTATTRQTQTGSLITKTQTHVICNVKTESGC